MKTFLNLFSAIAVCNVALIAATNEKKEDTRPWPKTVTEALAHLDATFTQEDKNFLGQLRTASLVSMHFGWGMGLRNGLPIWGNDELVKDAGGPHPDDVSGIIMEKFCVMQRSRLPKAYQDRITTFEDHCARVVVRLPGRVSFKRMFDYMNAQILKSWPQAATTKPFVISYTGPAVFEVDEAFIGGRSVLELLNEEFRKAGLESYDEARLVIGDRSEKKPNQPVQPMPGSVTPRAIK